MEVDLVEEAHPAGGNSNKGSSINLKYKHKNHLQTEKPIVYLSLFHFLYHNNYELTKPKAKDTVSFDVQPSCLKPPTSSA